MIYKLLGLVSFLVGLVFALLTILVFVPFLNNFNGGLLILVVLFGIFAFVFLSVSWQLLHPPKPSADEEADTGSSDGQSAAGALLGATAAVAAASKVSADPEPDFEWVMPSDGEGASFANLSKGHTDLEGEDGGVEPSDDPDDPYFLHRHGTFRKPAPPASGERPGGSSS